MSDTLRILHIADLQKMGGLEWIFIDFIRHQPQGMKVEHVIVNERSYAVCPTIAPDVYRIASGVYFAKQWGALRMPKRPMWCRIANRRRLIRKSRPDVVLVWSQFLDLDSKPLADVPVLYYEHGLVWFDHDENFMQRFFREITASIAVSRSAARVLQLKHQPDSPVHVVMNALRPDFEADPAQRTRHLPTGRPVRIGVAARLSPLKCVGLLILTIKALRDAGQDVVGRIAGIGPEESSVRRLLAESGMQDFVAMTGFADDMPEFYEDIDIYLNTSMHEAFSLVCIEAMAYGVPVVSGAIEGPAEIIEDGRTGLLLKPEWDVATYGEATGQSTEFSRQVYDLDSDSLVSPRMVSPQQFAAACLRLMEDPALYHSISANGCREAATKYRFERQAEELYALLDHYRVRRSTC